MPQEDEKTSDKLTTTASDLTGLEGRNLPPGWYLSGRLFEDLPDLLHVFLPPNIPRDSEVELVVTANGNDMPARDFSSYIALIDRLYGRLSPGGLMSYSHIQWDQLRISDIHRSELEIIFRFALEHPGTVKLLMIMLFLKGLPNGKESRRCL